MFSDNHIRIEMYLTVTNKIMYNTKKLLFAGLKNYLYYKRTPNVICGLLYPPNVHHFEGGGVQASSPPRRTSTRSSLLARHVLQNSSVFHTNTITGAHN